MVLEVTRYYHVTIAVSATAAGFQLAIAKLRCDLDSPILLDSRS
jgi:hypothetical protein